MGEFIFLYAIVSVVVTMGLMIEGTLTEINEIKAKHILFGIAFFPSIITAVLLYIFLFAVYFLYELVVDSRWWNKTLFRLWGE